MKILTVTFHRIVIVVDNVVYAVFSHCRRRYVRAVNGAGAGAGAPRSVGPPWTPRASGAAAARSSRASRAAGTPTAASADADPPLRTEGFEGVGVVHLHSVVGGTKGNEAATTITTTRTKTTTTTTTTGV